MTVEGDVYRVSDPGTVTESGRTTDRVTVPVTPGPLRRYGGPLALALGLVGLGTVAAVRSRGLLEVSPAERGWLAYRRDRESFDDWVTTGRVPGALIADDAVAVDSLEGLVDVAIDADGRVIEDIERDRYVVVTERGVGYVYDPPAAPAAAGALTGHVADDQGSVPPSDGDGVSFDGGTDAAQSGDGGSEASGKGGARSEDAE